MPVDIKQLYAETQLKLREARANVSGLQRKLTATEAERDRAEQTVRNLQHEYDLLLAKYNEVISK